MKCNGWLWTTIKKGSGKKLQPKCWHTGNFNLFKCITSYKTIYWLWPPINYHFVTLYNNSFSAQEYVAQWDERKRFKKEQQEKHSRAIAKFVAEEVRRFWQAIKSLQYDNATAKLMSQSRRQNYLDMTEMSSSTPILSSMVDIYPTRQRNRSVSDSCSNKIIVNNFEGLMNKPPIKRRSTSSNGSSNCLPLHALTCVDDIDKDDDDVELFELDENEINASDDDEITIEEQELFEAENTLIDRRLEWDTLSSDNQKSVDVLLRTNYTAYLNALNDNTLEDPYTIEDSSGVEDGGSDSDDDTLDEADDENDENEDDGPEIDSSLGFNHHEFDLEAAEKVLNVPLSSKQRLMYDDYMAGPDVRKALEGDGQTLSTVLNNLRKICNHPNLISTCEVGFKDNMTFPLALPRVADQQYWHPKILHAIEYDPWKNIDLSSLNMVYFDHEFTLTAITSDRIRKCCASRKLIEELASNSTHTKSDNVQGSGGKKALSIGPPVPSNRLRLEIQPTNNTSNNHLGSMIGTAHSANSGALFNQQARLNQTQQQLWNQRDQQQLVQTINGQHMFYTSTLIDESTPSVYKTEKLSINEKESEKMEDDGSEQKLQQHAFHEESLHVIARFNERRCNGMPLFGRDLVDALTVVDSVRPVRGCRASTQHHVRQRGVGYVNCLNAVSNASTNSMRPRKRTKIAKEDPEYRYQTNALKSLLRTVSSRAQIHSGWCDMLIKLPPPVILTSVDCHTQLHCRYSRHILPSLRKVTNYEDRYFNFNDFDRQN